MTLELFSNPAGTQVRLYIGHMYQTPGLQKTGSVEIFRAPNHHMVHPNFTTAQPGYVDVFDNTTLPGVSYKYDVQHWTGTTTGVGLSLGVETLTIVTANPPPPATPAVSGYLSGGYTAVVNWSQVNASFYLLFRNGVHFHTVGGATTQYVEDLALSQAATYQVMARNTDAYGTRDSALSAGVAIQANRPPGNPGPPSVTPNPVNSLGTIAWAASTDPDTTAGMHYYVDLSVDAKAAWTRILNNVQSGVVFDFLNQPATAAAHLRVLAADQWEAYNAGGWIDGPVFTIEHNRPPGPATWVSPASGAILNRAQPNRLTWQSVDPDPGDTQTRRDLRHRLVGAAAWTVLTGGSSATFHEFASNALATGNHEAQVLPYDSQGAPATAWSASLLFTVADAPATPVLTSPVNTATQSQPTGVVAWTIADQDQYRIRKLGDLAGNPDPAVVLYDSGWVVSATARNQAVTYPVDNRAEHVQLQVKKATLDSPVATARVAVSYTLPAVPRVFVTSLADGLEVAPVNPAPGVGQPAVVDVEVFRRAVGAIGDGILVRRVPPTVGWTDRWVGNRERVEYRVAAVGTNGARALSVWSG